MNISQGSLFHFTRNLDTLKSILTDRFYGSYCREQLHYKDEFVPLTIPMISFCDISLDTVAQYNSYGKYGIGLKKEWGVEKQLNPVFYLERNSAMAGSLIRAFYGILEINKFMKPHLDQLKKTMKDISDKDEYDPAEKEIAFQKLENDLKQRDNMSDCMRHIIYALFNTKHYSDELKREGQTGQYTFYNEREWRFLPGFETAAEAFNRTDEDYHKWRGDTSKPKPRLNNIQLTFSFTDIDHLIVANKQEVSELTDTINEIDDGRCPTALKQLLHSRVISFEELEAGIRNR